MAKRRILTPADGAMPASRKRAKAPDSEEDSAETENYPPQRSKPSLQKPETDNKDVQQFRARIVADRQRLEALLVQRAHEAEEAETRRHKEIASVVLEALKTPNRPQQNETLKFDGTQIARNAAYTPVADVLASSEALLREYERLDKVSKDMRDGQTEPHADIWHKELQEAERQLQLGARVAVRKVTKMLGAEVESDGDGDTLETKGADQDLNYGLHKSLRYAERGVKRMVKGLPEDEDC